MADEASSIARPYAEAIFLRAQETDQLDLWSDMLAVLSAMVADPQLAGVVNNPKLDRAQLVDLLVDVAGSRLSGEGQNLVKLLVSNGRVSVLPEIAAQFETRKRESQGQVTVEVASAFEIDAEQEQRLAQALKAKLGKDVQIVSVQDPELIGGVHIQAGDMVIDGSVRGSLQQLANELGI